MAKIKTYTPNEVAEIMGVSAQAVRHWVREGVIHAYRIGGLKRPRIHIPEHELNRFLKEFAEIGQ